MVAACGAALLFGGMRRTWTLPRTIPSILTGLGLVLLGNTRPFEGLLVGIPVVVTLGYWLIRRHQIPLRAKLVSWVLPLGAVLFLGSLFMAVYNRAVTGDWSRFPHDVHTTQYLHQGNFLFSSTHPPERTQVERIARLYGLYVYTPQHGLGLITKAAKNVYTRFPATIAWAALGFGVPSGDARASYLTLALWILIFVAVLVADRWVWFCCLTILFVVLGQSLVWWWYPHYGAPLVPIVLAAVATTLRRITLLSKSADWGRKFAPAMVVLLAGIFAVPWLPAINRWIDHRTGVNATGSQVSSPSSASDSSPDVVLSLSDLLRRLEQTGRDHLVFVRYEGAVPLGRQWVRNRADLHSARVILAHDLGEKRNPALVATYPGRSVWLAKVSTEQTLLKPYTAHEQFETNVDGQ
jgi:hypothetical protein